MLLNQATAGAGVMVQGEANAYPPVLKQQQPAQPDTLLCAMSSAELLTKRLTELYAQVHEIATAIGGPFPCEAKRDEAPTPTNPHAMYVLNQRLGSAHMTVTEITGAIQAIRRALGA